MRISSNLRPVKFSLAKMAGCWRGWPLSALIVLSALSLVQKSYAQTNSSVVFKFREEQDVGTYVGNVAYSSGITGSVSESEFSRLKFEISSSEYFEIDEKSGSMSTLKRIDRETVCSGVIECELHVDIYVYRKMNSDEYDLYKYLTVTVEITDINDNSPEFPSESVSLSIPESNDIDDVLRTSGAIDKDTGDNSVKQYSFQDPTHTFTLTVHKNPDGSSYLGIVIKETLDRETRDFYQVTVVATDGGFPQRSGSVLINITVSDINDNVPSFVQTSYNESVPENVALNVPIMKVQATDKDTGRNAEISYQFSSRVGNSIRQKFYIDEQTGEIFAQNRINYEEDKMYQFIVEAVDHGTPQYSSRAGVTLHIMDMNDNAPQININLPPKGTDVYENEPVGKFIAHISVLDDDDGVNGAVICTMDDEHFSLEKFYDYASNMYKVLLAKPLDHEQSASYKVSITCSDSGRPILSNSTTFVVNVLDVNDNRPAFTSSTYYGKVMENKIGETNILTVQAHDWDSGDFGRVTYSIEDKYQGLFKMDPDFGVLTVMRAVDRESVPRYEFHVIARDNGPERLSTSSLIVINVDDENDEPPHFPKPIYFGDVLENQPSLTVVGNVTAVDRDTPDNAKVFYTILQQGPDYGNFTINSATGVIKSEFVFDREEKDQYHFTIKVRDPDNPQFSSTCNFTVRVLDDNDHAPVIQMTSEENATIVVQYSEPVGSVITTIYAYDEDEASSRHSDLIYLVKSGDPDQLFNLNRYSGSLALARMVTAKDIKSYTLLIKVMDGGNPPRFDTRHVHIRLNGTIPVAASGGLSQNILIVIILVGVTVVLGLAILATICLIRKIDRQRRRNRADHKNSEEKMHQLKEQEIFANTCVDNNLEDSNSNNLSKKGKKEVSFSLDEETDSHNTSAGSGQPLTSFRGGVDRTDGFPQNKLSGPSSGKLGNGVWNIPVQGDKQSNLRRSPQDDDCHLINIVQKTAEDALSESSGETDPSDSGRGGSEDDSSHRGSGVDPEHNNSNNLYPQVYHRGTRSPTGGKDKLEPYQQPHISLHPHKPVRQTSAPPVKPKPTRLSGSSYRSPRSSLTSDIESDFSGSRASQSRSDSDRSVPSSHHSHSSFQGPGNSARPASQMLPFRSRDHYPSRTLTQDSPNRLAAPYNNSALMRSFHGHPSNSFQVAPPLASLSMERLGHPSSDRSYTPSDRGSHLYADRSDRWNTHSSLPEEDDRTTTSGSYTINTDELRYDLDEPRLKDSVV